ncbi:MAG: exosortase/archaeosortase family protein [Bryobacteraceae bacterium]|nr:exosortase/archaeosortase family protein [Bryobacteraceae bacterium]
MSSVAKPVLPAEPALSPRSNSETAQVLAPVIWFGLLLVLCYLPILILLVNQWSNDEDMGHGFFVPIVAGYIAWQRKDELAGIESRPNYLGLALIIYAAFQGWIGTLGAELFLARTAFVEAVVGTVLYLGGWKALRILAFPLSLLVFMIPIPAVIYNQITFPLQLFASRVAADLLDLIGIPVLREGNVLELPSQKLSVVEACSGIRSLLSLTFLSLVYAYFFDNKTWMRWALLIATVPIAIAANAFRVTVTGIMSEIDTELAHGFMHTAQGWVIFMIALAILVGVHQLIDRIYKKVVRRAS